MPALWWRGMNPTRRVRRPRPGSVLTVSNPFEVRCPCGGVVVLSAGDDAAESSPPAVIHAVPTCREFDRREPLSYVRWLNQRAAAKEKS